jgi:hypothetical protein
MTLRSIGVMAAMMACGIAGTVRLQSAQSAARPAVFLTLPTTHGFADATQALVESQNLLRDALEADGVRVVEHPDDADMVLTVLGRGRGDAELTAAMRALDDTVTTSPVPIATNERYIHAMITVGSCGDEALPGHALAFSCYKRSIVGLGVGDREARRLAKPASNSWQACADALARDVRAWLSQNAARVGALR